MASTEIEVLDPAATVEKIKKTAAGRELNRRRFVAALGMTGAAAGSGLLSGCSSSTSSPAVLSSGPGQTDILNFALNLEYLEATFYSFITQGTDLPSSLTLGSGAITGAPSQLTFTGANAAQITDMLNEIYFDELNHVTFLRTVLGTALVPRPAINLAAVGTVTASNALSIARLFEDVGVTAYAGAVAALIDSNITYASQILATESFHSGALRLAIILQNAAAPGADVYINPGGGLDVAPIDSGTAGGATAGTAAAATLAAAGPGSTGGFLATAYASSTAAGDSSATVPPGVAFVRTTSQVLAIVYGAGTPSSSGTSKGGFFPSGVNGIVNTV